MTAQPQPIKRPPPRRRVLTNQNVKFLSAAKPASVQCRNMHTTDDEHLIQNDCAIQIRCVPAQQVKLNMERCPGKPHICSLPPCDEGVEKRCSFVNPASIDKAITPMTITRFKKAQESAVCQ